MERLRFNGNIGTRRLGNKAFARLFKRDNWPMTDVLLQTAGGVAADNEGI